ncbi:hypothetical protein J7E91_19040 [Streptomyces sp. ISL-99]|uniref:hypothetical protein n=1 Tax=Streptomyces sp. ISL-99 TaxID=2819193 RepID=UPI001BEC59A3|nr:hypothetical protein [Streptomyces sp. ISL-99]MBT2527463.1 hypothetical protein [Streptomyces sp. ISL-99]
MSDRYDMAMSDADMSMPVPPLRAELYLTLPGSTDDKEVAYPFGHPVDHLGNTVRHLIRGGGAVEVWSPLRPALGDHPVSRPSWLYWVVPHLDFGWYGADFSWSMQDQTVRFCGGLRDGAAWGRGVHQVYAAGGVTPRLIDPLPAGMPMLPLVTTVPPPDSIDWSAKLIEAVTNPLGSPH